MALKMLYVMSGVPGSGKSTWIKNRMSTPSDKHISRDAIRFAMVKENEDYFSKENAVVKEFIRQIQEAIDSPEPANIYVDATHNNEAGRTKLLNQLDLEDKEVKIIPVDFKVPLEICLEQNNLREGRARVPDSVIRRMYSQHQSPTYNEHYTYANIISVERSKK